MRQHNLPLPIARLAVLGLAVLLLTPWDLDAQIFPGRPRVFGEGGALDRLREQRQQRREDRSVQAAERLQRQVQGILDDFQAGRTSRQQALQILGRLRQTGDAIDADMQGAIDALIDQLAMLDDPEPPPEAQPSNGAPSLAGAPRPDAAPVESPSGALFGPPRTDARGMPIYPDTPIYYGRRPQPMADEPAEDVEPVESETTDPPQPLEPARPSIERPDRPEGPALRPGLPQESARTEPARPEPQPEPEPQPVRRPRPEPGTDGEAPIIPPGEIPRFPEA